MRKYRKFNVTIAATVLGLFILLAAVNYVVDPLDIFHSPFLKENPATQLRFTKIDYLEKKKGKYNSFMLGSSRIGTTDPQLIEKYLPGSSFYNLTVHLANLHEDLAHLNYFVHNHYTLKNIYLQIDVPENMTSYEFETQDFGKRLHPHVQGESVLPFYLEYLATKPSTYFQNKIKANTQPESTHKVVQDVWGSGRILFVGQDKLIQANPQAYIQNEPSFHAKRQRTIKSIDTEQNMQALADIKKICDAHHIHLIMFITPHNHKLMDSLNREDYLAFLRQVSNIGDYWDFSGYNSVTLDDHNYYEASHYRAPVARLVAARIFQDPNVSVPPDFGVYITKHNVEQVITERRAQITRHDAEGNL
ncbi:hypothetical protein PP175_06300 [Aneurinibacillus sp. Ricciae_BoGa-3]|uniref:hypothetical protein n=1 Tax=Aneurinibacillus sp. Ricciae_BoGa-3 TaxID=3022697 RepID=UPI002341A71F|nr:hypothetical protein [Aneurinibacillus sp. Ricciae_BoGa-3]WCK55552.1 hypothetical protein PP175_06300 [Aneurinibacillus sp. Ricciae_BoGa-3]